MNILTQEIWNLFLHKADKNSFKEKRVRYNIHRDRLEKIIDSSLAENIDCIYFSDYYHGIQEKSKLNLKTPVYCKKKYCARFEKMILSQYLRREKIKDFSFSDFMFRDLNKKTIIRFERGDKFAFEKLDLPYGVKLVISIPIENNIGVEFRTESNTWFDGGKNGWKFIDLSSLSNTEANIQDADVENTLEEILESHLSELKEFISNNTSTPFENGNEIKNVLQVMYSSLAMDGINAYTYIPSIPMKEGDKEESSGGFIIPEFDNRKKLSDEAEEVLFLIVQRWFSENAIADFSEAAKEEVLLHTRKAAFAEVNARTTSHNTGSHVLANDLSGEKSKDLKLFQAYLRQRMLYNSDITSGVPSFETDYSIGDIVREFESQQIVKKYISGVTGCVFYRFKCENGISERRVSIPNGVLGLQALFVIFENMIRNYFKHVIEHKVKNLCISIGIEVDTEDHICITLSDGSTIDDGQFERIEKSVKDNILDENNRLRSYGLGFLEMKGAVCYLNKIPIEEIDEYEITTTISSTEAKKKIFEAINDEGKLSFNLWLRKPKTVLIFSDAHKPENDQILKENGIHIKSSVDADYNDPHQWVIIEKEELARELNQSRTSFSRRILGVDSTDNLPPLKREDYKKIFEKPEEANKLLHCEWRKHLIKKKGIEGRSIKIIKRAENSNGIVDDKVINKKWPNTNGEPLSIVFAGHVKKQHWLSNSDYYYEPYTSNGVTQKLISNFDNQSKWFPDELLETAVTSIVVLDERIQRLTQEPELDEYISTNNGNGQVLIKEVLARMKIYIPEIDKVNLNAESFLLIQAEIKKWIYGNKEKLDFLVIHLGIIEKFLVDKSKPKVLEWVNENILTYIDSNYDTQIVITTERGTPDNIPDTCRFIHYSNLVKYILEERSKYPLVKLLHNSRKPSKP